MQFLCVSLEAFTISYPRHVVNTHTVEEMLISNNSFPKFSTLIDLQTFCKTHFTGLYFLIIVFYSIRSLGSVVSSLLIDQEVPGSFPGSENYSVICTDWVFLFHVLCPCSVLFCLRRRSTHSADHRLGEALQLCSCSFMWSIGSQKRRRKK